MRNQAAKIRFYQRFRWKLTISYMIASVMAAVLVVLFTTLAVVTIFYQTDVWRQIIAQETLNLTPQIRGKIQDPNRSGEITSWLLNLKSGLQSKDLSKESGYSFSLEDSVVEINLLVANKSGTIIASTPDEFEGRSIRELLKPIHKSSFDAALAGETDPLRLSAPGENGLVTAIVPVKSKDGEVIGIMMAQIHKPFDIWEMLQKVSGSLAETLIITAIAASIFGAIFGFLTARRITGRIEKISKVTSDWEQGSFATKIVESGKDELSLLARKLNHMSTELKQLLVVKQDLATLEERNRLAMDLHDTVKQQIFSANMQLSAAEAVLDKDTDAARRRLTEARKLVRDVQRELSLMIKELRPLVNTDRGVSDAVDEMVKDWNRQNPVAISAEIETIVESDPLVRHEILSILRESLSNIARHSNASEAHIELSRESNGRATMVISDNGCGFDTAKNHGGCGLQNIKERSGSLPGGTFDLSSDASSGSRLEISWELKDG